MKEYYVEKIHNIPVRVPSKEEFETRREFYRNLVERTCSKALNYQGASVTSAL